MNRVYEGLRERILTGALVGGEVVSQVQIANEFDVSRSPVREAIRMLQNEGLVRAETNQRGRVATFSAFEMEQVCALLLLNVAAATLTGADRLTGDDWKAILQTIDRIERFAKDREKAPPDGEAEANRARQGAFRELINQLCAYSGAHVLGITNGFLDRIGMFRQLHESGHGRTPYPLDDDFSDMREAAERGDANATAAAVIDKIYEVTSKALAFVDRDYRPALLECYLASARRVVSRDAASARTEELTITVRAHPDAKLSYVVRED